MLLCKNLAITLPDSSADAINPKGKEEIVAEQFRTLVAQQSLLLKATGVRLMQDMLAKSDNPDELTHRVMQAIADYQTSRSAGDRSTRSCWLDQVLGQLEDR